MFIVEATTIIDAPPQAVWDVLMDFPAYEAWSTMLLPLSGERPQLGAQIELKLSAPGGPSYSFSPEVIVLEEAHHFAWLQKTLVRGVFDGEHHFMLTELPAGRTELLNKEYYRGVLSPVMRRLPMMRDAHAGFMAINQEIKARVERLASH